MKKWTVVVGIVATTGVLLIGAMVGATTTLVVNSTQRAGYTEKEAAYLATLRMVAVQSVEVGEKWKHLAYDLADARYGPFYQQVSPEEYFSTE